MRGLDFSIHDHIHASFAFVISAADPGVNIVALKRECFAGEFPGLAVLFTNVFSRREDVRIHDVIVRAAHVALVTGKLVAFGRARSKRGAFHGPAVVGIFIPVLENDIRLRRNNRFGALFSRAVQPR